MIVLPCSFEHSVSRDICRLLDEDSHHALLDVEKRIWTLTYNFRKTNFSGLHKDMVYYCGLKYPEIVNKTSIIILIIQMYLFSFRVNLITCNVLIPVLIWLIQSNTSITCNALIPMFQPFYETFFEIRNKNGLLRYRNVSREAVFSV